MNYLGGTWKSWREGSSSKETDVCSRVSCWAVRRGGIFEPQRGNCVWYLQHQHLLLDMLWDFVGYCPFTIPFSCSWSWWNCPGGTKGCELQRPHCSPLLSCLCSHKSGICRAHRTLYPHLRPGKGILAAAGPELRAWEHQILQQNLYIYKGLNTGMLKVHGGMGMLWESRILDPAITMLS